NAISKPEILKKTASVSVERFRDEWCKMLLTDTPSTSLNLLEKTGILDIFIPEFKVCRGCIQKDSRGFHEFDVADHLFYACDGAIKESLKIRLSAFFHDIGKPEVRFLEIKDGVELIHFHRHEIISEQKCRQIMTRLKFPNETINSVCHLVREHMFHYEKVWSDSSVRRFIIRIGYENFDDLIELRKADIYGMHKIPLEEGSPSFMLLAELRTRIEKCRNEKSAMSIKDLAVNGNDLLSLGIPSGKAMGAILKELFETVTDSPDMNSREKLLECAKKIWTSKYCPD
ncbi:MAG: HD domain-containing protein, partial [Treponema sp.]|nr:HD domain-containing protein [Treponema sp.]